MKRTVRRELRLEELTGIVARAKASLTTEEHAILAAAVDTLAFLTQELEAKGTTLERLRRWLFGASTEKTSQVLKTPSSEAAGKKATADAQGKDKPKPPGHGRNGAESYRGAEKVVVPHSFLKGGEVCAGCQKGKIYPLKEPAVLVRIRGMGPLGATVYELGRFRCNLCGEVFTAEAPAGVGSEKYDETAASMVALLKYGAGLPFHRIEGLQRNLGIPLPAATQWEIVGRMGEKILPAYQELVREGAQGEVLHNDDTGAKILDLMGPLLTKEEAEQGEPEEEEIAGKSGGRKGIFTSAIVAMREEKRIAMFFTGRKHAGENLSDVLTQRSAELSAPIQMCDALSRNEPDEFKTVLAACLAHARRYFVDVVHAFPDECKHLLETLREIYKHDAIARKRGLAPEERLQYHQAESGPLMAGLEEWLREQIEDRKVEPNSGLGKAIGYMRKHWQRLTLFLRVAGAPLDNNVCERALKKAILHRKNALFYKTRNGARVGDLFMTLIHTAELNGIDAFPYLVALARHPEPLARNPNQWMPWNYAEALAQLPKRPDPPGDPPASSQ
jgi:transposase